MKKPLKIPGLMTGRITLVSTSVLEAPRSRAASARLGLISSRCGKIIRTAIGTLKAICDNSTDEKPSFTPAIVNRIRNDAPMMTSGLTISTLFSDSSVFLALRLRTR
ncbi:hypothetical protein D3C76_1271750 [compost metagenome]